MRKLDFISLYNFRHSVNVFYSVHVFRVYSNWVENLNIQKENTMFAIEWIHLDSLLNIRSKCAFICFSCILVGYINTVIKLSWRGNIIRFIKCFILGAFVFVCVCCMWTQWLPSTITMWNATLPVKAECAPCTCLNLFFVILSIFFCYVIAVHTNRTHNPNILNAQRLAFFFLVFHSVERFFRYNLYV